MKFNQRTNYALNILGYLLKYPEERVTSAEIAEEHALSQSFVSLVLRDLKLAGIVKPKKGPGGGYLLNKSADKIKLKDVMLAVEEDFNNSESIELFTDNLCKNVLCSFDDIVNNFLDSSLEDMSA